MAPCSLLSVNVGLPQDVDWRGKTVRTSIYKNPVAGAVRVGRFNLEGDRQGDLSVHGGRYKAVYAYPSEHYAFWRSELGEPDLAWGAFGENLTIAGLVETTVTIGDRLRVGTAELQVTRPRLPCYKLGIRFGRADMEKRFVRSGRTGFYLSVVREGALAGGDTVEIAAYADESMTVAEIAALYTSERPDAEALRRASRLPALPGQLRERFQKLLAGPAAPADG